VFGNNDQERESLEKTILRHGFTFREPPFELVWHGRQIIVVHDPLELAGALEASHELVLHGHTHLHRYERLDGQVYFNPGESAGHMTGFNAVGVVDLEDLTAELLKF
jgi:putative phosphoesterase